MKHGSTAEKLQATVDKLYRDELRHLLTFCTEGENDLFNRMYPEGLDNIKFDKLAHAIRQAESSVIRHVKDGSK